MNLQLIAALIVACLAMLIQQSASLTFAPRGRQLHRIKRDHGVTGPVHTYVKTDKHANFKWGVRHHVGHQYSG